MREPVIRILTAAHKKTGAPQNRYIRLVQAGPQWLQNACLACCMMTRERIYRSGTVLTVN